MSTHDRTTGPMELVDRDTLRGMMVPWMRPARVMDDDSPAPYLEQFDRGFFDRQVDAGATNKGIIRNITFVDGHHGGPMGYALALEPADDGMWGTFRIRSAFVDDVKRMHDDGINGLSMRFHTAPRGGSRMINGVTTRLRGVVEHVALVATPAYDDARVAAVREDRTLALIDADEAAAAAAELADLDAFLSGAKERSLRWVSPAVHTLGN